MSTREHRKAQDQDQPFVVDLRTRDNWMKAFNERAAHDPRINKFTALLGNRIALHHNVKAGQCNPGIAELAKLFGFSQRHIKRALAVLVKLRWFSRKRGGSKETADLFMHIPGVGFVTEPDSWMSGMDSNPDDPIGDNTLSPMDDGHRCQHDVTYADAPYVTDSGSIGDSQGGPTYEQRNRDRSRCAPTAPSAPTARSSCTARVDRLDVTAESGAKISDLQSWLPDHDTMRTPEGAHAEHVDRKEPEVLKPDQIESLAELLEDRGGFGPMTRHLIDHVRNPDRDTIIRRAFALRRERHAAKQTAGTAA